MGIYMYIYVGTSFALTIGSGGVNDVVGGVTGGEVIRVRVEKRLIVVLSEVCHASAFPERSHNSLRDSDAEQHDAAGGSGGALRARARVVAVVSAQRTHARHRLRLHRSVITR